MAFWNYKKKQRIALLSEPLYTSIEAYLDAQYFFRCGEPYKNPFRRIFAFLDAFAAEEEEKKNTGEGYDDPEPHVMFSDYLGYEAFLKNKDMYIKENDKFIREHSFTTYLTQLLQKKNLDNVTVYKRAGIDRKLFSKIISNHYYKPSKRTILALAIGMQCNREETLEMLDCGGFTLSDKIMTDLIISYCISKNIYDMGEVNKILQAYDQPMLGSE